MNKNELINVTEETKLYSVIYDAYKIMLANKDGVKIDADVTKIDVQVLITYIESKIIEINEKLHEILVHMPDLMRMLENDDTRYYEFYNLPDCLVRPISDIRSTDINRFVQINGKIIAKGGVLSRPVKIVYKCNSCFKEIQLLPEPFTFDDPKDKIKCTNCGTQSDLKEIILEDLVFVKLEENSEDMKTDTPETLVIALRGHHTNINHLSKLKMGVKVNLTGTLKLRKQAKDKPGDRVLNLNSIEYVNDNQSLELTYDDKLLIEDIKKDSNRITRLTSMIDEDILGYHDIKESMLYYLVGAVQTRKFTKMINVLLIGEPGTAKSQMSKSLEKISHKIRYASGKNTSGVGLTAGVIKDEALGGYSIKMGAIPMCNEGHVIADELDKLTDEDKSSLLETMSLGQVTVSKIVQGTFTANTAILGIANPKKIQFNQKDKIYDQIGFTQDMFSRFEFIWIIKNEVDEVKDSAIAAILTSTLFNSYDDKHVNNQEFLKKYIKYVRDNFNPKFEQNNVNSIAAMKVINDFYVQRRLKDSNITPRLVNSITKVACAHAKLRQSNVIEEQDAIRATYILGLSLEGLL
jgi:replicative DNA helicase Mcm